MKDFVRTTVVIAASFIAGVAVTRYYDIHRRATTPTEAPPVAKLTPVDLQHEPLWAYGFEKPAEPGETAKPQAPPNRNLRPNEDAGEQTRLRALKGSNAKYSLVDVRDGQNVIDWFPEDHPVMPDVIKHGPATLGEKKRGCGSCHLPNGKGRPENAGVAGLPLPYILRQLQDFRSGKRHSADLRKPNTNTMIDLAKSLSDAELQQAAEYFSALPWTQWIRVVETDLVPKTRIVGNLYLPLEQARTEPIGSRIIEMPEDEEETETYRNPRVGFIAYVPPGSVAKGKDLVTTGGARTIGTEFIPGKNTPCITCHREDLMGAVDSPPIVGRSPSYIARQLWDIQQGTRNGDAVQLMKITIAKLTPDDILAVAAYIASLPPPRKAASAASEQAR